MKNNNKFLTAHRELKDFCKKCKSDVKATCEQADIGCDKLQGELTRLYYDRLYPFHPCRKCVDRVSSQCNSDCEEYWFYYHSRHIAKCELTDNVLFFTNDRSPFIGGHRLTITREYIESDLRLKKIVDFDVTEKYITEMKNSAYYHELLDTVRQYLEYCDYVDLNQCEGFFKDEFF